MHAMQSFFIKKRKTKPRFFVKAINGGEWYHTNDTPSRKSGILFSNVNNIHSTIPENQKYEHDIECCFFDRSAICTLKLMQTFRYRTSIDIVTIVSNNDYTSIFLYSYFISNNYYIYLKRYFKQIVIYVFFSIFWSTSALRCFHFLFVPAFQFTVLLYLPTRVFNY